MRYSTTWADLTELSRRLNVLSRELVAGDVLRRERLEQLEQELHASPGDKAANMVIEAFYESIVETHWERPKEPQIDVPVDEIATYRDLPKKVEAPKPKSFYERMRDWFKS